MVTATKDANSVARGVASSSLRARERHDSHAARTRTARTTPFYLLLLKTYYSGLNLCLTVSRRAGTIFQQGELGCKRQQSTFVM